MFFIENTTKQNIFIGCDFADSNSRDKSVYSVFKVNNGVIEILEQGEVKLSKFKKDYDKEIEQILNHLKEKHED